MLEGMGMLSADAPSGEDGSELKPTPDDQVILGRDDSRIEDDLVQGDSSPRELPDPARVTLTLISKDWLCYQIRIVILCGILCGIF